jgi:t-SNARE complex subunit (syntaxin)
MSQDLWKKSYVNTLQKISASSSEIEQQFKTLADTLRNNAQLLQVKKQALLEQIQQNEKVANQIKVAISSNTPALIVMEKAYPSAKADSPKKLITILAAMFSALAFSIIVVLVFERRQ